MEKKVIAGWLDKVHVYLLCGVVASIPFSVETNRVLIMVFAFVTLLAADWGAVGVMFERYRFMLLIGAFGILALIGMLYTTNIKAGMGHIERGVFTVVLPLLFMLRPPSRDTIKDVLSLFIFVCLMICIYCLLYAFWNIYQTGSFINMEKISDRQYYFFLNNELTLPANLSPIYLSLYVSFSIAILLVRIFVIKEYTRFTILMAILLHIFLILIFSLSSLVATFAIWTFVVFFTFSKANVKRRVLIAALYAGLAITSLALFYSITPLRDRFASKTQYSFEDAHISYWNSVTVRLAVWECAWDAIKDTPLYGHGTGDADDKLVEIYKRKNFHLGVLLSLNPHSQYLQVYLMHGIFGIAIFFLMVFVPMYNSFQGSDWLMFLFLAIMALGFLSECVLAVQKGIVFFSTFFPLLYLHHRISR